MMPSSTPSTSERRKTTMATKNRPFASSSITGAATAALTNSVVPGTPNKNCSVMKLNTTAATAPQPRAARR